MFVLPAYDDTLATEADRSILKIVTEGDHVAVATREWKYDWRRKAQPILAFLHLGPSAAARDTQYLKSEGITMLLVIRDTRSALASLLSGEKVANQLGIEAAAIDVSDYQELIAAFPRAIQTINNHLISEYRKYLPSGFNQENPPRKTWGKVLVFCESGNERSAEVVAAYLMSMYGLDLITAIQYIQTQRFCVAFDDNMKNLLFNYQQLLEAKRTVAGATGATDTRQVSNGNNNGISPPKVKRGREEVDIDDGDMDLDDADDEARFMGRSSFVPFVDDVSKSMA
jgi:serine/threonine/tyrosine-interacting protein